ncbi:MAG: FtsW/RodA/SpoVE family cell cycle protein [Actinomycetota bacterium]|nr:FtsW/RodA/SpoVE family cell cycle protein [Actinomycetota bacterium]
MTRAAEAALLAGAATLAAMGVALVNLAPPTTGLDAQVALTFLVFGLAFGVIYLALRQWAPNANPYLFPLAGLLTATGFSMIYRLDGELASLQRWWLLVAAGATALTLLGLHAAGLVVLRRYRYIFLLLALILLLLPLLPQAWPLGGVEVNGSRLWVRLLAGGLRLQFQPGELAKLFLVVFLASYLAERQPALAQMTRRLGRYFHLPEPRQLLPVLVAWLASFVVLTYQRDLGASLLLFAIFITMLYIATGRLVYLGSGLLLFAGGAYVAHEVFPHVQRRVDAWLHPFADFEETGYQIAQGLFALGSGSLTGTALGLGRPDLIPNAATDFIFAAVAEEMGLAGSIAVVTAFVLLVAVGFGIALRSRDLFRKLLAGGLAFVLGFQALLIIGGVIRLLPLTGITLPFVSYGGSSLLSNFILLAVLARVSHEDRS